MDPLLIEVPEGIETARMILRCPLPGDGAAVNAAVIESLNELRPWMPWAKQIPSIEETEKIQRQSRANFLLRQGFNFRLLLRDSGEVVGSCGIEDLNWEVPRCEIGYWLRTKFCGRGLMSEAVDAVTKLAFEKLKMVRVQAETDDRNRRSKRVLERCGFVLEATLRNHMLCEDGSLRDTCIYSKVSSDGTAAD